MDNPYVVDDARVKRRVRLVAVTTNPMDVVNTVTGEVQRATPYVGSRAWRDISDFVKVYDVMKLCELSERELKVFCWMLDELDYEGKVLFDGVRCCEALGLRGERSVYYGLRGLVKKDFIKRDKRGTYWVNPNIAYRGNRDELIDISSIRRLDNIR